MSIVNIRLATAADLDAINAIYNHYVLSSTCTYQLDEETPAGRLAWFEKHGPRHPVTVAERAGEIVGWGSLSPFHPRAAYARTVEDSLYIRHDSHRQGIGAALLADLIDRARQLNYHTMVALISADQPASITLHQRFGFAPAGLLREAGRKFDRWLDMTQMQLMLE